MTAIEVVAAVRLWQRKLWLCRRAYNGSSSHNQASRAGMWEFPGGKVEASDATLGAALRRECLEEFGAKVYVREHLASIPAEHDGTLYRVHFFRVIFDKAPTLSSHIHDGQAWMTLAEAMRAPHLPSGVEFLRRLHAGEIELLHDQVA